MKRILLIIVAVQLTIFSANAAENNWPDGMVAEKRSVSYKAALRVAQEAMATAKKSNTDVAVAVVDSTGIPPVLLRTDNATEQFCTGATRKALAAINFRNSTRAILEDIKKNQEDNSQLAYARNALFLMGGVPLKDGDVVIGGVGVAGSANRFDDDRFAHQAAEAFAVILKKKSKNHTRR